MSNLFTPPNSINETELERPASFDRDEAIQTALALFDQLGQPKVAEAFSDLSNQQLDTLIVELREVMSELPLETTDDELLRREDAAVEQEKADWIRKGHTRMSNWMIVDTGVSALARFLYQCLAMHAWQKDWCIVGQITLADYLGVSDRTIRDLLKELCGAGWIEIKRRGRQKPNRYTLKHPVKTTRRTFDQKKRRH